MTTPQNIIVTGAGTGIGKEIVIRLAQNQNNLFCISRTKANLKSLKGLSNSSRINTFPFDVSDSNSTQSFFNQITANNTHIDVLINCAGSFGNIGRLEDVPPKDFILAFQSNLLGTYNMIFHGLQLLKLAKKGRIINVSGGGATAPFPNYSSYACSKIALVKLNENLSYEYPDLDINTIAPGFIKTRLSTQTLKAKKRAGEFYNKTLNMIKSGGQPIIKVVDLVMFLLSKKSEGISGKLISAQWDDWANPDFIYKLKTDKDFCTLRRIDNINFDRLL